MYNINTNDKSLDSHSCLATQPVANRRHTTIYIYTNATVRGLCVCAWGKVRGECKARV